MTHKKIAALVIAALLFAASTQVTFFVIQPIGALPDGKTLLILRSSKTQFIDSADALCHRETGSVNLLCRAAMLGAVGTNSTILLRLPYSQILYSISTGGLEYDR